MTANHQGGAPDAVDLHVGRRLRALRNHAGLSLAALAARMGVSYQQLQKYERGTNRVTAGCLYRACRALAVPISSLYEGLPATDERPSENLAMVGRLDLMLSTPAGCDLIDAFLRMPHGLRQQYAALARSMVDPADPAPALRRPELVWGEADAPPRVAKGGATRG